MSFILPDDDCRWNKAWHARSCSWINAWHVGASESGHRDIGLVLSVEARLRVGESFGLFGINAYDSPICYQLATFTDELQESLLLYGYSLDQYRLLKIWLVPRLLLNVPVVMPKLTPGTMIKKGLAEAASSYEPGMATVAVPCCNGGDYLIDVTTLPGWNEASSSERLFEANLRHFS